ncbi:MAG: hypothetical protein Q9187_006599 [Circinaria calcarea]
MVLQAIIYVRGTLQILDQLELPHKEVYQTISNVEDAWNAIREMRVRGAPAIAIVAALALAIELTNRQEPESGGSVPEEAGRAADVIIEKLEYLITSRPTAVNLADAAKKLEDIVRSTSNSPGSTKSSVEEAYITAAELMLIHDVLDNKNIGRHGASWILDNSGKASSGEKISVLTHCNTGSLATAGYGTALGIVRSLYDGNALKCAYYTETRPYNQGSRLTGYELIHDGIPAIMITDSMAAALLQRESLSENIAAIVVGADRVAANGDTANKIGTYALAILARYHNVKFLIAAPRTTIDINTKSGRDIVIEERSPQEMVVMKGPRVHHSKDNTTRVDNDSINEVSTAAYGTRGWNPAFDVTPASLIDGIVTEVGVVEKGEDGKFRLDSIFGKRETDSNPNGESKRPPSPTEGP